MTYYITHLKDVIGNNYLGIKIPNESLQSYLNELKAVLGEEDYKVFTENQQTRDKGEYHITVINVADYNKICKEVGIDKFVSSLDAIFKYPIDDLKFMGIGTATRNEKRAFFIVCNSDKLEALKSLRMFPGIQDGGERLANGIMTTLQDFKAFNYYSNGV